MRSRLEKFWGRWIIVVLCSSISFSPSSFSALSPSVPEAHISVGKVGVWDKSHQEAYPHLVKQVQSWVENLENAAIRVSSRRIELDTNLIKVDRLKGELIEICDEFKQALLRGEAKGSLETLKQKMGDLRRKASGISELGPEIQTSLLLESAFKWQAGGITDSRSLIERALRIHPDGVLPVLFDWESSAADKFNVAAFDEFASKIRSKAIRSCSISFQFEPEEAQLRVNGFLVSEKNRLSLMPGYSHHLDISRSGFESYKQKVSCGGVEHKKIVVKLNESKSNRRAVAESSSNGRVGRGMIVIEPNKDRFKLFLYTPGKRFDEIPLAYPITLADLSDTEFATKSPIVSDAVISLFEKHHLLAYDLALPENISRQTPSVFQGEMRLDRSEKTWFDSPIFWGIVGGVLVGGGITYFATRNDTPATGDWE
jgi:hypothetical protein